MHNYLAKEKKKELVNVLQTNTTHAHMLPQYIVSTYKKF